MVRYLHRNGWLGFSLACVALAAPLLLAVVHLPMHASKGDACCAAHPLGAAATGFSNAETDCPICRQLDAYLSQTCVSVPVLTVAQTVAHHEAPVSRAPGVPRAFLPDRSGWARPPPA